MMRISTTPSTHLQPPPHARQHSLNALHSLHPRVQRSRDGLRQRQQLPGALLGQCRCCHARVVLRRLHARISIHQRVRQCVPADATGYMCGRCCAASSRPAVACLPEADANDNAERALNIKLATLHASNSRVSQAPSSCSGRPASLLQAAINCVNPYLSL